MNKQKVKKQETDGIPKSKHINNYIKCNGLNMPTKRQIFRMDFLK